MTPLAKYALTLLPIASSIEELVPSPRLRCYPMSILIRTTLVFSSLVVALSFPYFGKYYPYYYHYLCAFLFLTLSLHSLWHFEKHIYSHLKNHPWLTQ